MRIQGSKEVESAIERLNAAHINLMDAYAATDKGRRPQGWRQAIDRCRTEKLAAQAEYDRAVAACRTGEHQ